METRAFRSFSEAIDLGLLPKKLIDFRREKNSPVELDAEETRLRYMAFEETWLRLLTLALAEESKSRKRGREKGGKAASGKAKALTDDVPVALVLKAAATVS